MSRFVCFKSLLNRRILLAGLAFTIVLLIGSDAMAQTKKRGLSKGGDATSGEASAGVAPGGPGSSGGGQSQGAVAIPSFKLEPRQLKGAVIEAPAELVKGAPFNTKDYFTMPDAKTNAGPLVLDALTELSEVYAAMMGGIEPKESFETGLKERRDRSTAALEWIQANPNPRQWDANAIEKTFGPYRLLFAKLHEAHKLPECVIPTGFGIDTLLPHVQAAKYVAALSAPLVYADLARGDKKGAIAKFGDALRLGQDIQARAYNITGLVVIGIHKNLLQSTLPILLNSRLNEKDCDEILAHLKSYRDSSTNLLLETLKSEYLSQISTFQNLSKPGYFKQFMSMLPEERRIFKGGDLDKADALVSSMLTPENVEKARAVAAKGLKEKLEAIGNVGSADDLAKLGQAINESYRKAAAELSSAMADQKDNAPSGGTAKAKDGAGGLDAASLMKILESQFLSTNQDFTNIVDQVVQFQTTQSLMESLTATRRWYLTKKTTTKGKSLEEVAKEAKLEGAPLDGFSGKPLKLIWIGSGPAVYSIGSDRKDDNAKAIPGAVGEDMKPSTTGDWIVPLAFGADPLAPAQQGGAAAGAEGGPGGFPGGQGGGPGFPGGPGAPGGRRGGSGGPAPGRPD